MGHKVSRHKSYAICRIDGLPGQYRPIKTPDSYGSQTSSPAKTYEHSTLQQGHDLGVTADRKYVTAINDIGSQGIKQHRKEPPSSNDVSSGKTKPKPKPRKTKDINSNEKNINGDVSIQEKPKPAKRKSVQQQEAKHEKIKHEEKLNGVTTNSIAEQDKRPIVNGTVPQERKQKAKAIAEQDKRPIVNGTVPQERKQKAKAVPHVNSSIEDDDVPVSNVDLMDIKERPKSVLYGSTTSSSPSQEGTLSRKVNTASTKNQTDDKNAIKEPHFTRVSVIVHKPYTETGETNTRIDQVPVTNNVSVTNHQDLYKQEEIEPKSQVLVEEEQVNTVKFERAHSNRNSQVRKSVAFSDECVDIEENLSQSHSRNGFHEKMDSVYGTGTIRNEGDKWVTLDATDASDFIPIQRQKVPGQSILKKSKYPPIDIPPLELATSSDSNNLQSKENTDYKWEIIGESSNSQSEVSVTVPAPRGRLKGYHRPPNQEIAKTGSLADYIKQKSGESHQTTKHMQTKTASNGVIVQNGGSRSHSRSFDAEISPRYVVPSKSSAADPRGRALSPSRAEVRVKSPMGRSGHQDGYVHHSRKSNGYHVDPAVYYLQSSHAREHAILDSRGMQRQGYPQHQQNVKIVVSNGKQKASKKKQQKHHLIEHPKQQRNNNRQQWMVGNL